MKKILIFILSCMVCHAHGQSSDMVKIHYVDLLEGGHIASGILLEHACQMLKNHRSALIQAEVEYEDDGWEADYEDLENLQLTYYQMDCQALKGLDVFSVETEDVVVAYLKDYVISLKDLLQRYHSCHPYTQWSLAEGFLEDLHLTVIFSNEEENHVIDLIGQYCEGIVTVIRCTDYDKTHWIKFDQKGPKQQIKVDF